MRAILKGDAATLHVASSGLKALCSRIAGGQGRERQGREFQADSQAFWASFLLVWGNVARVSKWGSATKQS